MLRSKDSIDDVKQRKIIKQRRKASLKKKIARISNKKKRYQRTKFKAVQNPDSVRTYYEEIWESYLRLLAQPYVINTLWCFSCNNYYDFTSKRDVMPKKCRVCGVEFYSPESKHKNKTLGYFCRPDFILDFNTQEDRNHYRHHTYIKNKALLDQYHDKYTKNLGIVRIDGGQHTAYSQQKKDYKQYRNFVEGGIKVFIVTNEDIDNMLIANPNGDSLLRHAKFIADCVNDDSYYLNTYCKDKDFQERTKKPFGI